MATVFGGSVSAPLFSSDKPWIWAMIPVGFVVIMGALALCLHSRRRARYHFNRYPDNSSSPPAGGGTRLDSSGTRALERDLEEAWVRGATGTRRPPPPTLHNHRAGSATQAAAGGRWARPSNRWQWIGVSRPEEGLNELGEAPPPYEKPENSEGARKAAPSATDGEDAGSNYTNHHHNSNNVNNENANEDFELQNLSPPPPAVTITRAISTPATSIHGEGAPRIGDGTSSPRPTSPPAYNETSTPRNGEQQRDHYQDPSTIAGVNDDGTAIVTVTPLSPAVLPSDQHRPV
ncbi:hypothetical protein B0H66DRAFT_142475 [Apodospora peruviana]|uniref:Uncharacterized protein n=1 Tax=Apodospora peruviana TaxID=516989 RepID=A0AAE0MB06_9PEZI|nr:hypothetical protein B0H66DRAFT_142475 [Apodospora peruviana]